MPNEHGEYTEAEAESYEPGPCPQCGSPQGFEGWHHSNPNDLGEPRYVPGLLVCTNDRCQRNAG